MNSHHENASLLEVRVWKEQCRQEDQGLSTQAYLEKIKRIADDLKAKYHVNLMKVSLKH